MHIWVDADACPNVIKSILFRAAERAQVTLTLVANQLIRIPPSRFVKALQVPAGFDVADDRIVQMVQAGDLVVTGDIPLAAAVIAKGGRALDPRGEFYTGENIGEKLSVRKLMDELRASGVDTGGPQGFSNADRQTFANSLDRFLSTAVQLPSRGCQ
ncbi:MAG TPA: YaiI/YqxD family protein [Burkholderiales bacterium]|nr:YaiI/YqxD family protein [Burkholderiales bacterium]